MSVAGILFTGLHRGSFTDIMERTVATLPFLCRYRMIDFALSNMVNADITNVNVITKDDYHSLIEHIGSGKDWDLARRSGGLTMLPPYLNTNTASGLQSSPRLSELKNVYPSLSFKEDHVVLCDCDTVCSIDLNEIVNDHIAHDADITVAVKNQFVTPEQSRNTIIFDADETGRIFDTSVNPSNESGYRNVSINIMVIKTDYLMAIIDDSIAHGYGSFSRDVIAKRADRRNFRIYKYDGAISTIADFNDYYNVSMRMLTDHDLRNAVFNVKNRPVYTRVRNSVPTKYNAGCVVHNSLIADGCTIEGRVENSILFRGVKVGRGTVVKNSILFQDTITGENVELNCVVTDRGVVIRDRRKLSGHESLPFYIGKGKMI